MSLRDLNSGSCGWTTAMVTFLSRRTPSSPIPRTRHPTVLYQPHTSPPREDQTVLSDGVDISNWNDMDDFLHLGANLAAGNPPDSKGGPRIAALHIPTSAVLLSPHNITRSGRMTPLLAAHSQRRTEQGQHESWKNWSLAPGGASRTRPHQYCSWSVSKNSMHCFYTISRLLEKPAVGAMETNMVKDR